MLDILKNRKNPLKSLIVTIIIYGYIFILVRNILSSSHDNNIANTHDNNKHYSMYQYIPISHILYIYIIQIKIMDNQYLLSYVQYMEHFLITCGMV